MGLRRYEHLPEVPNRGQPQRSYDRRAGYPAGADLHIPVFDCQSQRFGGQPLRGSQCRGNIRKRRVGSTPTDIDQLTPCLRRFPPQYCVAARQRRIPVGRGGEAECVVQLCGQNRPPLDRCFDPHIELGILGKDGGLEVLQFRRRVDPQFLDQDAARPSVRSQRLALPSRPIKSEHLLRPETLPQGMLGGERFQLADQVPVQPECQVGVDARLQRRQSHLLQTGDLPVERRPPVDIGVGVTPPQRQRRSQLKGRAFRVRCQPSACRPVELLEITGVDLVRLQRVPATRPGDHIPHLATEIRHVGVDSATRPRGGVVAVHALDERID